METNDRTIGESLRRIYANLIRRPMGWNLIDAFTRLEEREEAQKDAREKLDRAPSTDGRTS